MKKLVVIASISILIIGLSILGFLYFNYDLEVTSIKQLDFNMETNEVMIEVIKKDNIFDKDFTCTIFNDNVKIKEQGKDNKCTLKFEIGSNYSLILEDKYKKSVNYNILDYFDNILNFNFKNETIYMVVGESKKLEYTFKSINGNVDNFSTDSNIVTINDDIVTANNIGDATIYKNDLKLNVVVTDLIISPTLPARNKELVPCNRYTEEEGKLLDNILSYKVNSAGNGTRAGVVAAARFLMLEFPYKIPYFYENGRVNKTGVNFADGEGRYYHKGLYLTNSKKKDIIASVSGPVIWGCPLCNWEDDPDYGYIWGKKMPNGLDCSGFVSWVLYNGGFDPGDLGAGDSISNDELTDLGDFMPLTNSLINSGKIKVGDLVNYWGHIAIIIGIDDENYYVAESLQDFGGVTVNAYKKEKLNKTFSYVALMDSYYKEDGNYTKMW